jgi:hypothetical protein
MSFCSGFTSSGPAARRMNSGNCIWSGAVEKAAEPKWMVQ